MAAVIVSLGLHSRNHRAYYAFNGLGGGFRIEAAAVVGVAVSLVLPLSSSSLLLEALPSVVTPVL